MRGTAEPDTIPAAAAVVIPAYRAAETIAACLRGLLAQDLGEPFEIVVVASGGDATADIVRSAFPQVRCYRAAGRLTPGTCRNFGIAVTRAPVVAFCAADCIPAPDWLRRRVALHRGGASLVGGFVDVHRPATRAGWAQYLAKFGGMQQLVATRAEGRGPLFHLSYARPVLDRFGPFPDGIVAGEDTVYNDAIVAAGITVHYDAGIRIEHVSARTWAEVRDGQRLQGLWGGVACRTHHLERYFAHWLSRRNPLLPLLLALRTLRRTARYRPSLLLHAVAALPLTTRAVATRRRAFRDAYTGAAGVEPLAAPGPITRVTPRAHGVPRASVIVAAYDEERLVARCIDSLLAQTLDPIEVIVVDDGSRDRTAEIAATRAVPVLTLPHRGPARARNEGAARARGEALVFIDADLECEPESIARLVAPILSEDVQGTFTKDMYVANREAPWAACWTLNRGFPAGCVFPPDFPDTWSNYRAVRRSDFARVGGYDDVGYGEDMTLAPKLGVAAVAVPGAVIWHHNPDSLGEIWANARWIGRGVRVREIPHVLRRYWPGRSMRLGWRIARRSGRRRFLIFKLVYDAGVVLGYTQSQLRPRRHWK
ncbi:MAG TPA: glycosyltransferase [Candidatus Dormibacteraeota bacterium]|jgi:glycosyltransferase involved in cell wall biosynthesis|nr:glycosyltransferase [Candidatus Dormibacteraeota bacterium]